MIEDKRIIQVRGMGETSQAPDQVVIKLDITSLNKKYEKALQMGAKQLDALRSAIKKVGFSPDDLKTVDFYVNVKNENESYKEGKTTRYRTVFIGFEISQKLKLVFDFDSKKLSAAIDAIAGCMSEPEITVNFEVKDEGALKDKILESAAKDARRKAEILCASSGVKLGKLLRINYSWDEIDVHHSFEMEGIRCKKSIGASYDFTPEDIETHDTVDFIWEIK